MPEDGRNWPKHVACIVEYNLIGVSDSNGETAITLDCYISIHSFSNLSYERYKTSSKASSPHSAVQIFLFQMRVPSPFLKVIQ
jgi:hypothetical protein